MLLLRRPHDSRIEQYETIENMMARECRRLSLRGVIASSPYRTDYLGPTQILDSILVFNRLDPHAPIWLEIDSEGGSVDSAMMLYDVIRMSIAPVNTIGETCISAAVLLLAAGHRRCLYPHSRVMLHLPSGGVSGDVKEIAIRSHEFGRVRDAMVDAYIECGVKRTRKQILKDIDREMWLTAQEAIDYGLADEIIDARTLFGRCLGVNRYPKGHQHYVEFTDGTLDDPSLSGIPANVPADESGLFLPSDVSPITHPDDE
jgi:ATP-dependent Clp protease protease subunit